MTFSDLDLSLTLHPIKKDILPLYDDRAIQQALKNVLLTENYDYGFDPNFGSQIHSLLFENISSTTTIALKKSVEVAIRNYEPRVNLTGVVVTPFSEENYYKIDIYYYLVNTDEQQVFSLFLQRLR